MDNHVPAVSHPSSAVDTYVSDASIALSPLVAESEFRSDGLSIPGFMPIYERGASSSTNSRSAEMSFVSTGSDLNTISNPVESKSKSDVVSAQGSRELPKLEAEEDIKDDAAAATKASSVVAVVSLSQQPIDAMNTIAQVLPMQQELQKLSIGLGKGYGAMSEATSPDVGMLRQPPSTPAGSHEGEAGGCSSCCSCFKSCCSSKKSQDSQQKHDVLDNQKPHGRSDCCVIFSAFSTEFSNPILNSDNHLALLATTKQHYGMLGVNRLIGIGKTMSRNEYAIFRDLRQKAGDKMAIDNLVQSYASTKSPKSLDQESTTNIFWQQLFLEGYLLPCHDNVATSKAYNNTLDASLLGTIPDLVQS